MIISAVVDSEKSPFLLVILAKLMLTEAVSLVMELRDTLTDLCLFYEHRHDVVKLFNVSMTSTTDAERMIKSSVINDRK